MSADGEYYCGLMTGTSMDALDGCVLEVKSDGALQVIAAATQNLPPTLQQELHALCVSGAAEIDRLCRAQNALARCEAQLVQHLLDCAALQVADVMAIGSHGQTVRHCPQQGYTVQLDNGPLCALLSGIDVWTNFRMQDVAAGGEGAPLTPIFHQQVLAAPHEPRYILNLGGISNVTALRPGGALVCGFDIGPANTLLDLACRELLHCPYDKDGQHARRGKVNPGWLTHLLLHPFFARKPPKSSGRELFNGAYIAFMLEAARLQPSLINDVLSTLTAFTVQTIADALRRLQADAAMGPGGTVLVCGGGVRNTFLMQELTRVLKELQLQTVSTQQLGIDPAFVEAAAFAYFAYLSEHGISVDLHDITGAQAPVMLGTLCPAPHGHFALCCQGSSCRCAN